MLSLPSQLLFQNVFIFLLPNVLSKIPAPDPVHYALNPFKTKRLAVMEESLALTLFGFREAVIGHSGNGKSHTTSQENLCLMWVCKYLDEFDEDGAALDDAKGYHAAEIMAGNPFLVFKMIRRIHLTLMSDTMTICGKDQEYRIVTDMVTRSFRNAELFPPTEQDWHDALLGILRIHFVHGFDAISQLRLGILNDVDTKAHLSFEDCVTLANKALDLKAQVIAYQWIIAAMLSLEEKKYSAHCSFDELNDELERVIEKLMALAHVDSMDQLHKALGNKRQESMATFNGNYKRYAPCRGEYVPKGYLRCYLETGRDPYFAINPVKTEVLSENPPVLQFYDFVGNETMEFIKDMSLPNMERSAVVTESERQVFVDSRTSLGSSYDDEMDPDYPVTVMRKLNERIEKLIGMEVNRKMASDLQVAMYGSLGGHYDFHLDSLQNTAEDLSLEGDRLATFLIFTSDVKMGGYTAFDEIGVFAKPVKGSAILWFNLYQTGRMDYRSSHSGCPVILGYKDVANLWIYEYESMFKQPCLAMPRK